jgi:hypothetical protein
MTQVTFFLAIGAAVAAGLLAGTSLDQSIKQLPARHRIGIQAYSAYSQASDLANGILFYAVLGIGAALLAIAFAIAAHLADAPASTRLPANLGAALAVLHSLATAQAAPANFSQRQAQGDPVALTRVFDRFARWQTVRVALQLAAFGAQLWALIEFARTK